MERTEHDLARLRAVSESCDWLSTPRVLGAGLSCLIDLDLHVPAYAWRESDREPIRRSGPFNAQILLGRGLVLQPLARVRPDADGYVPAGGNISDWWTTRGGERLEPGLICYADRWDPTCLTLGWLVYQLARIVCGEVLQLEARALSPAGRDFAARALEAGLLPTRALPPPRHELLYIGAPLPIPTESETGIEFHAS